MREGKENKAFQDEDGFAIKNVISKEEKLPKYQKEPWNHRYKSALKTILPFRNTKSDNVLPVNHVGLCNYLTVGWISGIMWKALREGLNTEDVLALGTEDDARRNAERLQRLWDEEVENCKLANEGKEDPEKVKPSLPKAIWRFGKTRFLLAASLVVFSMIFQFIGPAILLKMLLDYLDHPTAELNYGIMLVVLFFLCQFLRNISFNLQQSIGIHTAIRVLGAVQFLGYSKLLRLASPNDQALGQFITFVAADHERIQEAVVGASLGAGAPLSFVLSVSYAIYLVGPSALVGCVITLLFFPIMGIVAKLQSSYRERVVSITDKRVTSMKEIIDSMRLIKMYAWEESFLSRILEIRSQEIKELFKPSMLMSCTLTVSPSISILAGFGTTMVMTLTGVELSTTQAFTVMSVFSALQFSISTLPWSIRQVAEANVGFRRLQQFLELAEYRNPTKDSNLENQNLCVEMRDTSYSWEVLKEKVTKKKGRKKADVDSANKTDEDKNGGKFTEIPTLFNIDLKIEKGSLTGVAGLVGSGKSSLLSAMLGEMKLTGGLSNVSGKIAVVTQQSWIFNGTVRDNILMGSDFDKDWYSSVVDVCALARDLQILENGDMTEVGERGITLSGGQKQRISLARALYSKADIFLLDDPLSAVDAKVGQHIFQKYVKESLKNKTVILVTHGMQYLKSCDNVIFMKEGRIVEDGNPTILLNKPNGFLANIAQFDYNRKDDNREKKTQDKADTNIEEEDAIQKTEKEETGSGTNTFKTLINYFNHAGHPFVMVFIFTMLILFIVIRMFDRIYLQMWLDQGDGMQEMRKLNESYVNATDHVIKGYINYNPDLWKYQLGYTAIIIGMLLCGFLKGAGILVKLMSGSKKIHKLMILNVMRSPMSFFDVTPSGWILNRFSKDMDVMDTKIPFHVEACGQYLFLTLCQVLMICFFYPWFTIPFVIIIASVVALDWTMQSGVKETKRLDNQLKAPVIHHITSSMSGIITIRGFQKEEVFKKQFNKYLNTSTSADSLFRLSTRWFMWRMESMALITVTVTAFFCVAFKDHVPPAVAGLVMVNVFQTATFVPFVMNLKANLVAFINSLARNFEYTNLKQEAPAIMESNRPSSDWPQRGGIHFRNVSFRYRPELPLVLRGVTVDIVGGERVGIVGRTGAGKSSLISTLLRLTELDGGNLIIDGVDISDIGLKDLRSAIAVIPQDPVLFQGTVRYNIDPFEQSSDSQVWLALEESNLKEKVTKDPLGLNMAVEADGDNFSVGEKQLICLARALLRKNKILLLDEATASVDVKTDHLIQNTIQSQFQGCTVLTIAHRLNTIINYDKVLVLDQGSLVQADSPAKLLDQPGLFREMAEAAGLLK